MKKKSQSIVEYLLVFGCMVVVILLGVRGMAAKTQRQYIAAGNVADKTSDTFAEKFGVDKAPAVTDATIEEATMSNFSKKLSPNEQCKKDKKLEYDYRIMYECSKKDDDDKGKCESNAGKAFYYAKKACDAKYP